MKQLYSLVPLALCALLNGCAKHPADPQDPYEPLNRNTYKLNNCIDHTLYRPVAQVYRHLLPEFVRTGVTHFFENLDEPVSFPNDLAQGKIKYASIDVIRFVINSTIGIAGLFDVATKMGLPKHSNSFGNTFAYYSDNKKSPYFIIPFLGPSTFRDTMALPFSVVTYAFTYVPGNTAFYASSALYYIELRSRLLPMDKMLDDAFDPYAAMRDAYLSHRNATIAKNDSMGDYNGDKSQITEGSDTPTGTPDDFTFDDKPTQTSAKK